MTTTVAEVKQQLWAEYAAFNEVYRTYFKGPLPARAFLGTANLLGNAHFEVMGIAVKQN